MADDYNDGYKDGLAGNSGFWAMFKSSQYNAGFQAGQDKAAADAYDATHATQAWSPAAAPARGTSLFGSDTNRGVLVRIKNADELARSQGHMASLAQALAPSTIEAKVYDELAKQLKSSLKDKNVDADVTVVEPSAFQSAGSSHIASDIGLGLLGAGAVLAVGALIWRVVGGKRK